MCVCGGGGGAGAAGGVKRNPPGFTPVQPRGPTYCPFVADSDQC